MTTSPFEFKKMVSSKSAFRREGGNYSCILFAIHPLKYGMSTFMILVPNTLSWARANPELRETRGPSHKYDKY